MRDERTRPALRFFALILLGGITGVLLSRFLLPTVFERGVSFVVLVFALLLVGVVLAVRSLRRGGSAQ